MIQKMINEKEFATYFENYIKLAPDIDISHSLKQSQKEVLAILNPLQPEKWNYSYAAGKWTIKEMLLHIIDTERVMAYRAMRIARNDSTSLPGFDHDNFVVHSNANQRSSESLLHEFNAVRASTLALFESFEPETMQKIGNASNVKFSVRALGFIIAGHEIHHLNILKERYL